MHAPRINQFLTTIHSYEADLLTGRFANCLATLDAVEAQFGKSLWAIEQRMALLQFYKGLEVQKAYLAELVEQDQNAILRYLADLRPPLLEAFLFATVRGWPSHPRKSPLLSACARRRMT